MRPGSRSQAKIAEVGIGFGWRPGQWYVAYVARRQPNAAAGGGTPGRPQRPARAEPPARPGQTDRCARSSPEATRCSFGPLIRPGVSARTAAAAEISQYAIG